MNEEEVCLATDVDEGGAIADGKVATDHVVQASMSRQFQRPDAQAAHRQVLRALHHASKGRLSLPCPVKVAVGPNTHPWEARQRSRATAAEPEGREGTWRRRTLLSAAPGGSGRVAPLDKSRITLRSLRKREREG